MSLNVLLCYINNEITEEELINWLNSSENKFKNNEINGFSCNQSDFIIYFINFLHDTTLINNTNLENQISLTTNDNNVNNNKSNKKDNKHESFVTSTPIINKNAVNLNATWPRKTNEETKTRRNLNFYQKDHSLCLGDFVCNIKAVGHSNKQNKKRIKPTFVENRTLNLNKSEVMLNQSFNQNLKLENVNKNLTESFNENIKENVNENVKNVKTIKNEVINLFKGVDCENIEESRNKIIEDLNEIQIDDLKLNNSRLNFNNLTKIEINPDLESCKFRFEIDLIVKLYVYLIKNDFNLNILTELYFLTSLLTLKQYQDDDFYNENVKNLTKIDENTLKIVLKSIHNQIYFSLETLNHLKDYLRIFDKITLNLLLNNSRIKNYFQRKYFDLETFIKSLINEKNSEISRSIQIDYKSEIRNVNFTTETDNKDNFTSLTTFHAFRKQRDAFYDLLNVWEEKLKKSRTSRESLEWNFNVFQQKIKYLINLCTDSVNLRQLAKLFKSQLLLMCNKDIEDDFDQNEEEIFKHFPGVDSLKLNKLKQRLSSKNQTSIDFDSIPEFYGYQEFFKGFILNCLNPSFLEHLKDVFLAHILTENDYIFTGYDLTHRENVLKTQAIESLNEKLTELIVLAKFLGYIESLPYQNDSKHLPKKVLQNQIETRSFFRPILDLNEILNKSIDKKRLVLTISWVVIYLSMFDYVSLRLPYFQKPIQILYEINRKIKKLNDIKTNYTNLLIIVSLNWLFGLSYFPNFINSSKIQLILNNNDKSEEYFKEILNGNHQNEFPIDELNLITENCLYLCIPSLETFKNVLLSTNNNNNKNNNVFVSKHITPFTSRKIEPEMCKEKIQKQLEEAFLNSQSETVRKLIEFATEKVTSGCIQHLTVKIIDIRKEIVKEYLKTNDFSNDTMKNDTKNVLFDEIKTKCLAISEKIIEDKVDLSIKGLMSIDELPMVVEKCVKISKKICREKIKTWMEVGLSVKDVEKTLMQERKKNASGLQKKVSSNLTSSGKTDVQHLEESLSGIEILNEIKELMINLIENQSNNQTKNQIKSKNHLQNKEIQEDDIKGLLDRCKITIENRSDINDNVIFTIQKMIVDLSMVLVCFNPSLSELVLNDLKNYWIYFKPSNNIFKSIVSIRNVHMLSKSADKTGSWKVFVNLLTMIVQNRLVNNEDFEEQCLSVFKQNWDDETLKDISAGYQRLIENLREKNVFLSQLLTFMSTFCSDLSSF